MNEPRRRGSDPRTEDEWEELAEEMRRSVAGRELGGDLPTDLDELHARNVRIHGHARADMARWKGLAQLAMYLYECEKRRKERAMAEALEALERAREAEKGEARWLRVGCWLARRFDAAASRLGSRSKIFTRIDFSPQPTAVEYGESIEPTDLEEGDIPW